MNENFFYSLQVLSTFSILPAMILGFFAYKKLNRPIRCFLYFCSLGFLIDLAGWYMYLTKNGTANLVIRFGYILVESVFYCWFVGGFIESGVASRLLKKAWIAIIPLWLIAISAVDGIPYFKVIFQIAISFALSYCLLSRVEKEGGIEKLLVFWLLLGSFFYFFCTFFFMNFLNSRFGLNLWYARNIISMLANFMFAWGFFVSRRRVQPSQSPQ
ncbi:MAG TPA: hypothetical protein VKQ08_03410 [Cyclobacteriaceae bacterium]|nr:hypothetical protein [Cyclobacteriaceae bacterium]